MSRKKTTEQQKFLQALRDLVATHESLYALARRLCSGLRRPPTLDPKDHLHDAVLLILELVRKTPDSFRFPHRDLTPERWVYLSVRRVFHSKAFYHREFAWATRRIDGHAGATKSRNFGKDGDSGDSPEIVWSSEVLDRIVVEPLTEFEATIEDLCGNVPEPCRPLLRLMSQGATSHQAAAVLGKTRSWVQWRLSQIRKALALLPSVRCPKKFTKLLLTPKK